MGADSVESTVGVEAVERIKSSGGADSADSKASRLMHLAQTLQRTALFAGSRFHFVRLPEAHIVDSTQSLESLRVRLALRPHHVHRTMCASRYNPG